MHIIIWLEIYELNQSGPNCKTHFLVRTENECKAASTKLNITYKYTVHNANRPAGCYKDSKLDRLYLNRIIMPDQTNPTNYEDKLTEEGIKRFTSICISDGNSLLIIVLISFSIATWFW